MKEQSTMEGFTILTAASMVSKVMSVVYLPVLLLIIGKEAYGIYAAAYVIFTFVYVVINSGVSVAMSKIIAELTAVEDYRGAERSFRLARSLMTAIGLVSAIIVYAAADRLAGLTGFPLVGLSVRILSPALFFTPILSVYRGYFQGHRYMTPTAVSQIIEQFNNVLFSLLFAALWIKQGLAQGCAGGTVGTSLGAFTALLYLFAVKRGFRIRISISKRLYRAVQPSGRLIRTMLYYGAPITASQALQNAGALVDMANIKHRLLAAGFSQSSGNILFGILTNFNVLVNVPITLVSILTITLIPALSALFKLERRKAFQQKVSASFRLCLLLAVPSTIGLAVLSRPIYHLVFPSAWEGYKLMLYGSAIIVLWSLVLIETAILQSAGRLYAALGYTLVGVVAKVVVNYLLVAIPRLNIMGAIIGNLVYFLIPLVGNFLLLRKMGIGFWFPSDLIKTLLAGTVMALFIYPLHFYLEYGAGLVLGSWFANAVATVLSVAAGGYIYLFCLIIIGEISRQDLDSLPGPVVRLIPRSWAAKLN